jgi:hypothetical protein
MLDDFPAGDSAGLVYTCPHCNTELEEVVPLFVLQERAQTRRVRARTFSKTLG